MAFYPRRPCNPIQPPCIVEIISKPTITFVGPCKCLPHEQTIFLFALIYHILARVAFQFSIKKKNKKNPFL